MKNLNILITGAGAPGWSSVLESIRMSQELCHSNIYSCDITADVYGAKLSKKHFVVPHGQDPDFSDALLQLINQFSIDLVIPITDPELIACSLLSQQGKAPILVSSLNSIIALQNKLSLYTIVQKYAPVFTKVKSYKDIKKFYKQQGEKPFFLKAISSHGSRGTKLIVDDKIWLSSFFRQKPQEFGMTFPFSSLRNLSKEFTDDMLISEFLPGIEYSVDCVFSHQSSLEWYGVRAREKTVNGICSTAKFIPDTSNAIQDIILDINELLPMRYNVNIQLKEDANGNLKLLEINPRIPGSIGSFLQAGHNLVEYAISLFFSQSSSHNTISPQSYKNERSYRVSRFI